MIYIAGVSRVWVVDNQAQSISVFGANELPQIFGINDVISDVLLPELTMLLRAAGAAIALVDLFARK